VCGHVHEGRGAEKVKWKLDLPYAPFLEEKTTSTSEAPLANDGARSGAACANQVSFSGETRHDDKKEAAADDDDDDDFATSFTHTVIATPSNASLPSRLDARSERATSHANVQPNSPDSSSVGVQEHFSRLHQQNVAALSGRYGRQETCIVNASIMAQSWGRGPKRLNKPVVVDMDMPAWKEESFTVHSE